jgi:hypothetical protein
MMTPFTFSTNIPTLPVSILEKTFSAAFVSAASVRAGGGPVLGAKRVLRW